MSPRVRQYQEPPHMPHRDWLRSTLIFRKLPEMNQTIKELKKKITELESKIK